MVSGEDENEEKKGRVMRRMGRKCGEKERKGRSFFFNYFSFFLRVDMLIRLTSNSLLFDN